MHITIFAGKGGVGKSTSAAAYASEKAKYGDVLLIDYDGGHSIGRVLSLDRKLRKNTIAASGLENIAVCVVEPISYTSISDVKEKGGSVQDYLSQFKGDHGLVPFCDMITTFFGVPTDVASVSRYTVMTEIYHRARERKISEIVVDVEPTAGLGRLLESMYNTCRSITNLEKTGWAKLKVIGATWPDIGAYLKGDYIQNGSKHATRLANVGSAFMDADYFVVTIPESSPVDEAANVERLIRSYAGKVAGFVINNIRVEKHEGEQIRRVREMAKGLPIVMVSHDERLCDGTQEGRIAALREMGSKFR